MIGELVIPLDKVQSFSAEKPAVILGTDQTTVRGQTELEPSGDWKVTSDGQPQVVAGAIANVVLPESTYHDLFEQSAHVWQQWKGAINFGYAVQRGDQKTRTVNSVIKAVRERSQDLLFTPHWRTNYGLNMLYAKAKQDGVEVNSTSITPPLCGKITSSPLTISCLHSRNLTTSARKVCICARRSAAAWGVT